MKDRFNDFDDLDERGVLRPWLLTILLVTAGLTLWTFDGKLDGSPSKPGNLAASDNSSR